MNYLQSTILALVLIAFHISAAEDPVLFKENVNAGASKGIVVAITSFQVNSKSEELTALSSEIQTLFEQKISEEGLTIVEREKLSDGLKEAQLSMAGVSDPDSAKKLGKVIGADYIIAGRLSELAGTIFLTGKAVDTETSQVIPVGVELKGKEHLGEALSKAAHALAEKMGIAKNNRDKTTITAKETLPEGPRPNMLVLFRETHITQHVPDPASEAATVKYLMQNGFKTIEATQAKAIQVDADRFKELKSGGKDALTQLAKEKNVDVIVIGEAFSERATGVEGMITCRARVEAHAYVVRDGIQIFYDGEQGGASDLAEFVAGKKAIETAAQRLAPKLAKEILARWKK